MNNTTLNQENVNRFTYSKVRSPCGTPYANSILILHSACVLIHMKTKAVIFLLQNDKSTRMN